MSNILLASQRRLFASSLRMAKPHHKRFPAAFFSTQVEEEDVPPPLETFLNGTSSLYAEQMYEMYLEDPSSVQETWRQYFENEENAVPYDSEDFNKPTSVPGKRSTLIAGVRDGDDYNCCLSTLAVNFGTKQSKKAVFAHGYYFSI